MCMKNIVNYKIRSRCQSDLSIGVTGGGGNPPGNGPSPSDFHPPPPERKILDRQGNIGEYGTI